MHPKRDSKVVRCPYWVQPLVAVRQKRTLCPSARQSPTFHVFSAAFCCFVNTHKFLVETSFRRRENFTPATLPVQHKGYKLNKTK